MGPRLTEERNILACVCVCVSVLNHAHKRKINLLVETKSTFQIGAERSYFVGLTCFPPQKKKENPHMLNNDSISFFIKNKQQTLDWQRAQNRVTSLLFKHFQNPNLIISPLSISLLRWCPGSPNRMAPTRNLGPKWGAAATEPGPAFCGRYCWFYRFFY